MADSKEDTNYKLRAALHTDIPGILEIYNEALRNTTATFDTEEKDLAYMTDWFNKHNEKYCLFVAEHNNSVAGWASLSRWSDRCAYDDSAEISVYIYPAHQGKGLARKLMHEVIEQGRRAGVHTILSRITAGNAVSVHLHEAFGFAHIGLMREVGRKFGQLLDVHMMQKML